LIRIDAEILQAVLTDWLRCRRRTPAPTRPPARRIVAIDGKVLRGARLSDGRQVHLLSAYDTSAGIVLAQVEIAAKSNELFRSLATSRMVGKCGSVGPVDAVWSWCGRARE
jgi:hypothetical protein